MMEASLLAVTPTPVPPQETPSPTTQTTDDASPFTAFLSTAMTAGKATQKEQKDLAPQDTSTSDPSQQEMSMAAALTALAFQDMPALTPNQPAQGQDLAATLTSTTNTSSPILLTPSELKQFQAILVANGQDVSEVPPGILKQFQAMLAANGQALSGLIPGALKQLQTILVANGQDVSEVPPGILKQFQAMLAANKQTLAGMTPAVTEKQATPSPLNKTEALVNQQLQAILSGNSQDTLKIHTSHQSAPDETLNTLSSPYLKSADNASEASLPSVHMSILEGVAAGAKETDTVKGVRQNVAEQFLHAKFDGLVDKNNTKNQQQDNGRQESSQNQQNTANATLITSLNAHEQAGQFNLAALGAPVSAAATANAPVAHPATWSPGVPVPAEEIISHLVDRFSTNPRLQTSKISLNLNPAELGALKIDILVKGDSIKAHIVAGSQQIQDTIEKNMPKLRSILEQQGFTIEDFQVTLESTNPDASNFFQQQFASRQDSGLHPTVAGSEDSFDLSLNSAETMLNAPKDSGVNLSI